jgi:hypothetical protein
LAGGGLQHIAPPQTSTLGEAHVHDAGVPLQVGVPSLQVVVHAPQWLTVFSGVSHPGALVQSPNPALQDEMLQLPLAQVAVAFGCVHAIPQPPQLVLVLVGVSQPSVSLVPLEQLAYPAAQADCGTTQPPEPLHCTLAPDFRWGSAVQS